MSGIVSHIEFAGRNGDVLREFYSKLFDWEYTVQDMGGHKYAMATVPGDDHTTSGIRYEPEGTPEVVVYVTVDDLEARTKLAEELGGSVRIPPMDGGDVRFSLVVDPEGNPVGMVQSKDE